MVRDYVRDLYGPATVNARSLNSDYAGAQRLAAWKQRVKAAWPQVRVEHVESSGVADAPEVGSVLSVRAFVALGDLAPDDVEVQLVHGLVDNLGEVPNPRTVVMSHNGAARDGGAWVYRGTIPCRTSGHHGFAVRVLPKHPDLANPFEPGLITWG
jgi:starch phosphorylase